MAYFLVVRLCHTNINDNDNDNDGLIYIASITG